MASFDANINLLIDAQAAFKAVEKLEKRILKLQNAVTQAGAFKEVRSQKREIDAQVRQAESRLANQLRLNAALERQANLLKGISRAGVSGGRKDRVDELVKAGAEFKSNLRVQNAINTALEKELQTQREINRTDKAQNATASKTRVELKRRIDLLKAVGATESEINKIIKTRDTLVEQTSKKQTDLASESFNKIDRQLKTLERKYKTFLDKPGRQLASPLSQGPARTVLDTPQALKQKAAYYDRIANSVKALSSPMRPQSVLGSDQAIRDKAKYYEQINKSVQGVSSKLTSGPARTVLGSNDALKQKAKYYDQIAKSVKPLSSPMRAQSVLGSDASLRKKAEYYERIAKSAKTIGASSPIGGRENIPGSPAALRAQRRQRAQTTSNLGAGIGFPLLFGGGPGSVIGGALGSAGGFGTQILASAIGGIIDQAVAGVAKLGQALNPLTADIDAVVAAAGESGTAFEQLVKDLEKVAGKEAALAAATAQLATVIGTSGVTALRQFGAESTELGNEVAQALTIASSAVAEFINQTGILAALITNIDASNLKKLAARNTTDPELQRLKEQRANIGPDQANPTLSIAGITIASDLEDQIDALDAAIVARQRAIQLEEQLNIKTEAGVVAAEAKAAASNVEINSLKAQIALEESGLDLTTEAGVALAEKVIEQQTYVALQAAINSGLSTEAILLNETLQKLQLKARAVAEREAAQRKAEAAARKAANEQKRLAREAEQAAKKAAQLEASLNGERARQLQLGNQSIALEFGEKIALQDKLILNKEGLTLIQKIYNFKREQIKLTTEDSALEKEKLATLALQEKIETDQTKQKLQQLDIAERLAEVEGRQSIENTRAGLEQELGGLALGQTPELELANEQANRLTNTIKGLDDQLEKLRGRRTGVFNQELETNIETVKDLKTTYQELLPQIFAAEQAQLKYNQAFAAITPAVNSLVGGLQDVVAGTKTAEQAFADFLNTIADQLVQTAATMIAQYIALGIARMFALGGNPGAGASDFNLSGGGSSVGSGGLPGIDSLGGLFNGSLPFIGVDALATGGTANGGQPYIVGEQGPELFIPGVTGTVTNNDQFEAARNALSDGSTGDAFDENGEALSSSSTNSSSQDSSTSNYYSQNGAALAAISRSFSENNNSLATSSSYMRESAMERESQTTVSSGGSMVIETQVINNVEYATVEQVAIASAASAKQARAQVFSDMKNKPSRRAMVGLR